MRKVVLRRLQRATQLEAELRRLTNLTPEQVGEILDVMSREDDAYWDARAMGNPTARNRTCGTRTRGDEPVDAAVAGRSAAPPVPLRF